MMKRSKQEAATSNPALGVFNAFVGEWKTEGTHPLLPGVTLHGRSSFQWIEEGAFLIWRSEIDDERFPKGIAILGSDDATGEYCMLYFDERKVSRKYELVFQDNIVRWWRNAPNFSQQYTWAFADNGNTIIGKGMLCRDGSTWEKDLDVTFTRVK